MELAFILPIVVGTLALVTMGGQGFMIDRKVALAAHTVTDLVARTPYVQDPNVSGATAMNQSDLALDLALAAEVLYPGASSNIRVVVSELLVNAANKTGTVQWSVSCFGATALPLNTVVAIDPTYVNTGATYLIYGQLTYSFQPLGIIYPISSLTLSSTEMLTVRNGNQITLQGAAQSCP